MKPQRTPPGYCLESKKLVQMVLFEYPDRMELGDLIDSEHWSNVLSILPDDLDASARIHHALRRRREIASAKGLLRMIMAYAASDRSLQSTCDWAESAGIATISKPALFYRVRDATSWLIFLLRYIVNEQATPPPKPAEWLKLTVVDAVSIDGPRSGGRRPGGQKWWIHVRTDVDPTGARWQVQGLEVSGESGGDGSQLQDVRSGDIVLSDGNYASARSINDVGEQGAYVIARSENTPICDLSMTAVQLVDYEAHVAETGMYSTPVLIPIPPEPWVHGTKQLPAERAIGWIDARLLGSISGNGEVAWLLTTVPQELLDDSSIVSRFGIREQVRRVFQRLKQHSWLDRMPAPESGPTAVSWIVARFLAAALFEKLNSMTH